MKTYLLRLALLLPAFLFATLLNAQADGSGTIKATVLDIDKQPLPGAIVRVLGTNIGAATDMDGVVNLRAVSAGTYEVEVRMVGYKAYVKRGVVVSAGQTAYLSYPMQLKTCDSCEYVVYGEYTKGPVDKEYSTLTNITAEQIKVMAVSRGDVTGMVTNTCSSCSQTPSGGLVMRGSRPGQSQMFVDGEKIYGSASVPGLAIGQITVLSGGIPAEYGDLSGGAIIVTTKDYIGGGVDKRNMYNSAAEEKAAQEKAEAEKNGVIQNGSEIIEEQKTDSTQGNTPAPQEAPAAQPQPQNNQAPQAPATPAEQPR
ncbi:MAG: carboxypeptidase regulatory-like domain-containing protein [Bacteroidia bacterium]